ncbi:unnamed protein product, partial [Rotaria socialis]
MGQFSIFSALLLVVLAIVVFNVSVNDDHPRNRRDWGFSACARMQDVQSTP